MKNLKKNIESLFIDIIQGKLSGKKPENFPRDADIGKTSHHHLAQYYDIWQCTGISESSRYDPDKAWQNLKQKIGITPSAGNKKKVPFYRKWIQVAAAAIILIISGYFSFHLVNKQLVADKAGHPVSTFHVPYGSKSVIDLQDGTRVWLNSGSTLGQSIDFGSTNRDVYLQGEAYFEVRSGHGKPFRVHTKEYVIHVTGTSFNVRAYNDEMITETTVIEGSVNIFLRNENIKNNDSIKLEANQMLTIRSLPAEPDEFPVFEDPLPENERLRIIADVTTLDSNRPADAVISWKDNRWNIRSEKLEDLAKKIERRYNVRIILNDPEIKEYIFSGAFRDESLEQVIRAISASASLDYKITDRNVHIRKTVH